MSGELQSIPARHGTATFVPRGQTIKIINTYGKQVVDTWIFGLHEAPDQGEDEEEAEVMRQAEEESRKVEEGEGEGQESNKVSESVEDSSDKDAEKTNEGETATAESKREGDDGDDSAEKKVTESVEDKPEQDDAKQEDGAEEKDTSKDATKNKSQKLSSSWSSYIPSTSSLPSFRRSQNASATKSDAQPKEKRTWSSYFPSGVAYSSYLPSKQVLSGFASTHTRDPTKSYAEQLYDFSKTPVGAASLSGMTETRPLTRGAVLRSLYAAYSAYTKLADSRGDSRPMEYLSLAHTAAESGHLVPRVDDALLSNLRQPLATLVEDTSEAGHDALSPACDAAYYLARGGKGAEEHGSCAENLVLALKELNEKAGLKGRRTVGADVSVYGAPGPWHLFQNGQVVVEEEGAELQVGEPKGVKRGYVKLRAERDVVVVMSACPDDMSDNNGGKCMAANFVVEEKGDNKSEAKSAKTKAKASSPVSKQKTPPQPERKASTPPQPERKPGSTPQPERKASSPRLERKESATPASSPRPPPSRRPSNPPRKLSQKPKQAPQQSDTPPPQQESQEAAQKSDQPSEESAQNERKASPDEKKEQAPVEKKKPKKLERRVDSAKKA